MTAIAQSRVDAGHSRAQVESVETLVDHDRDVRPGGSFSRSDDLGHRLAVAFRIVFLVFVLEPAGIFPAVAFAPRRAWSFVAHSSEYFRLLPRDFSTG